MRGLFRQRVRAFMQFKIEQLQLEVACAQAPRAQIATLAQQTDLSAPQVQGAREISAPSGEG